MPTLPRRWGSVLTLRGLWLTLTAISVRGVMTEQCGTNSLCGYGTRCETKTSQCVCLSDNGNLRERQGNHHSEFYCLENDLQKFIIVLATGAGGAMTLVVVMVVVLVWKHRSLRAVVGRAYQCDVLVNKHSHDNASAVGSCHSNKNVVNLSLPGEKTPSSRDGARDDMPSVDVPAHEHQHTNECISVPLQPPHNKGTSALYESADTPAPQRSECTLL
ncbi:uncharacterized protein LOC135481495 [Liolophura sinensis]|uniref:uncharacterized protein LOC135481495 n=1 Tax=Liolophura sinensis TaxID=3198878 RepID=UPI003157F637